MSISWDMRTQSIDSHLESGSTSSSSSMLSISFVKMSSEASVRERVDETLHLDWENVRTATAMTYRCQSTRHDRAKQIDQRDLYTLLDEEVPILDLWLKRFRLCSYFQLSIFVGKVYFSSAMLKSYWSCSRSCQVCTLVPNAQVQDGAISLMRVNSRMIRSTETVGCLTALKCPCSRVVLTRGQSQIADIFDSPTHELWYQK